MPAREVPTVLPIVLRPGEDGWIVAECALFEGCISQGRTVEEATANLREAISLSVSLKEKPQEQPT